MKPIMKSNKDEIEDIVNIAAEKAAKKVLETTIGIGDGTGEKKFSEVLKDIKNKGKSEEGKDQDDKGKHEHNHSVDEIDCPTCKTSSQDGRKPHKLHSDGKSGLVCTGPDCKHEYLIIPKARAEYVCESCGQSHIKIETRNKELRKNDKCVNCGKDTFVLKGNKIDNK